MIAKIKKVVEHPERIRLGQLMSSVELFDVFLLHTDRSLSTDNTEISYLNIIHHKEKWSDVLNSIVADISNGKHGAAIDIYGCSPERLSAFVKTQFTPQNDI